MAIVIIPILFTSCSIFQDKDTPAGARGKIAIHITDAPFPANLVEHVFVTIRSVGLRHAEGSCVDPEGEDPEFTCEEGFLLLLKEPVTIDLLLLRNGLTDLLVDAEIPLGKYDMLRLYVEDAKIVVEAGMEYELKIPSGSESGLKVKLKDPVVVTEEGVAEILVDFDLSRSFIAIGNPKSKKGINGFIFKPVIRAVDVNKSGKIKGKVTDEENIPLVNAGVTLFAGTEELASAITGESGEFVIAGVPAGTYSLKIEMEGYHTQEITGIVVSGKQEVLKTIKLKAE